jgi:hypothetical protein
MQIYYTDSDSARCAANLPDALTNKILIEVAQILCTVCHKHGIDAPYKPTHENHPFVKWASESDSNWKWLKKYGLKIGEQFEIAYNKPKGFGHKTIDVIWYLDTPYLSEKDFSEPPIALSPSTPNIAGIILSGYCLNVPIEILYKNYLKLKVNNWKREGKCKRLYTWTNRPTPDFITFEKEKN